MKSVKIQIILTVVILVVVGIGVGVLMLSSNKPVEYAFKDGVLDISGMYGQKVDMKQISSLELKESIPQVLAKTNGSGLGNMLKGHFKLESIGEALLFIDKSKPPFIYITTDTTTIILNCKDSKDTRDLYDQLSQAWKGK